MTDVNRGASNTLTVEWRLYAGGPFSAVTGVTIKATPVAGGAPVLGPTAVGITNPTTGINVYVWSPAADLPVGDYLIEWSGTDPDSETVGAAEIVHVLAGGALGGPYGDWHVLKSRMGIPDSNTTQDDDLQRAMSTGADTINRWCGRQFGRADTASARSFPVGRSGIDVDDFWTLDNLSIGGSLYDVDNPTYAVLPTNGIVDGVPGWPYWRLVSSSVSAWALAPWPAWSVFGNTTGTAVVSAQWGWASIPDGVIESNYLLGADDMKAKDAPFGVANFGDYVSRVRANPRVAEKLDPYVHPRKRLMVA